MVGSHAGQPEACPDCQVDKYSCLVFYLCTVLRRLLQEHLELFIRINCRYGLLITWNLDTESSNAVVVHHPIEPCLYGSAERSDRDILAVTVLQPENKDVVVFQITYFSSWFLGPVT